MSFKAMMEPVARDLLGKPTEKLGLDWRYGKNSSLSVDVGKGIWFDHEAGEGGGVVKLVEREKKCTGAEAIDYLEGLTGEQIRTNGEDHHQKDIDGAREARRIYAESVEELPEVARKYFEKRGLNVLETFPGLRWSEAEHALVIPIGPTAVQRIKLDKDGNKVSKMSRGPMEGGWHLKRDGAHRLHEPIRRAAEAAGPDQSPPPQGGPAGYDGPRGPRGYPGRRRHRRPRSRGLHYVDAARG
jgi:hypothetical protein